MQANAMAKKKGVVPNTKRNIAVAVDVRMPRLKVAALERVLPGVSQLLKAANAKVTCHVVAGKVNA